jgi:hypothetical protein
VGVELANEVGVALLERGHGEGFCVHRELETAAIFEDVFARVPRCEAEIEDFFFT